MIDSMEIKKAEKVEDENGWTGLEIKYVNKDGEEKRQVLDDFEEHLNSECDCCGKEKYKCRLEKCEKVKHPKNRDDGNSGTIKSRKRKDVTQQLK